jgi:hypothetical protein
MTPMELQYLVGLGCLRRNPDAVEIVLGDMVFDEASEKARDVDVTVRVAGDDGVIAAFKGFEVKQENKPLDVATVEQLAAKFGDMPDVTYRAIVSASGFTEGARKKATHHGVDLYQFEPWTGPIRETLPSWNNPLPPDIAMRASRWLLYWGDARLDLVAPAAPAAFQLESSTSLFDRDGTHAQYSTFSAYREELLLRSTGILWRLEPAVSLLRLPPVDVDQQRRVCRSMAWAHTHTLGVEKDGIFLAIGGGLRQLTQFTISGRLYWESAYQEPEYKVLRRVADGQVFASAMVAGGRTEGELLCMVFDPTSSSSGLHFIQLTATQQKVLRRFALLAEANGQGHRPG